MSTALAALFMTVAVAGFTRAHGSTPPESVPSFSAVERKIFRASCATTSCHGAAAAGGLSLTRTDAYANLVNVPPSNAAAEAAGLLRVVPGEPERSLLLAKLEGTLAPGEGARMPAVGPPLPAAKIDTVRRWIAAGAPPPTARPAESSRSLRPVTFAARSGHVNMGDEEQFCHHRVAPRRGPTDIGRVEIRVRGGSHHVHLYRSYNGPAEYPPKDCPFAIDFDKWQLLAATQNPYLDWWLPPGVAINLGPEQPLLIQTHFVNAGQLPTRGAARAKIKLYPVDSGTVTAHGGALFAQDRAVRVLPGRTTLANRCALTGDGDAARDLTIMAFTGHYHFRGVEFQVYRVRADGTLGELLYEHQGYEDPPFREYPPEAPIVLRAGEGIEWRCTYQNDTEETFEFGANTQRNEHCNLFGFYYPTETPREAIDCVHSEQGDDLVIVAQ